MLSEFPNSVFRLEAKAVENNRKAKFCKWIWINCVALSVYEYLTTHITNKKTKLAAKLFECIAQNATDSLYGDSGNGGGSKKNKLGVMRDRSNSNLGPKNLLNSIKMLSMTCVLKVIINLVCLLLFFTHFSAIKQRYTPASIL